MMIEPRIVSRLTHVDSFTHTYAYTYTHTHTHVATILDILISASLSYFYYIRRRSHRTRGSQPILEIRRFMIRKIRAFCYYVPSRTLHCLVCTISQKSFHCTFNILSLSLFLSLIYNYLFFLPLFLFFTRFDTLSQVTRIYPQIFLLSRTYIYIMLPRDLSIYYIISYLPSLLIFN